MMPHVSQIEIGTEAPVADNSTARHISFNLHGKNFACILLLGDENAAGMRARPGHLRNFLANWHGAMSECERAHADCPCHFKRGRDVVGELLEVLAIINLHVFSSEHDYFFVSSLLSL